jgi:hypothetical protein
MVKVGEGEGGSGLEGGAQEQRERALQNSTAKRRGKPCMKALGERILFAL